MAIEAAELKIYKSSVVNNLTTNGGRMGTTEVVSAVSNNVFPNVTQAERTAGVTRYRKVYSKIYDDDSETLYNHKALISRQSPAGDYVQIKAGTNTDTQAQADDYTAWLGCGKVNAPIIADSTSIEVLFEINSGVQDGDSGWLSDGTNEEYVEVSSVSWISNTATIILAAGTEYAYSAYSESVPVWFASYADLSDTTSGADNIVATTAGDGTFDATYMTLLNKGCIEDSWTLTFSGVSAFTCVGTNSGLSRAGSKASTFEPVDALGDIMFRVTASAWVGTWTTGDTLTFDTHHAAKAIWLKEVVPASTVSYSNNTPYLRIAGESA
jgi:hypothetical protein